MNTLHQASPTFNCPDQTAFVTASGHVYRATAQGGIQRLTPLALALMASAGSVACWRIETRREG